MHAKPLLLLSLLLFFERECTASTANKFFVDQRPNILFLMVDDLGFNDVSWRDPRMQTPELEKLAFDKHTVLLNQSYVNQECSPTRSSFLTGIYPHHVGVQDGVFQIMEPSGVPTWFKFLPEDLKTLGYGTYIVGKWHLGYCNESYLPTSRGFDKHFGIYQAMADHYTHFSGPITRPMRELDFGLDFWYQNVAQWGYGDRYSTDIYVEKTKLFLEEHDKSDPFFLYLAFQAPHFPLQVPKKYTMNCKQKTEDRRLLCVVYNYAQPEIGADMFGGGSGAAVRVGKYKLIVGNPGYFNDWYEVDATDINWRNADSYKPQGPLDSKVFLFDLNADPTESNNLAEQLPEITEIMLELLKEIGRSAMPSVHVSQADLRGHPSNFNNTLASGWCNYVD
uniref:Sulfatase N-terminal domain-containing protein n=1 Tax=Plectus sambesii TaxID=2011161 RepID=A0A914VZN7_9BILA